MVRQPLDGLLSAECRDSSHRLQSLHTGGDLSQMQYLPWLACLTSAVPLPPYVLIEDDTTADCGTVVAIDGQNKQSKVA